MLYIYINLSEETNDITIKPCLPIFGSVSAREAVALSPPITPSQVPLPMTKDIVEVPPEPQQGISRVAEIMRFGFPGLDNIRSHRLGWKIYNYVICFKDN